MRLGRGSRFNLRTLERQIERSLVTDRLIATLSTGFGALATVLALIGLYGVMAYTVARRTREIGLRMALGGASADVVWLVMREVLWMVGRKWPPGFSPRGASRGSSRNQLYGIAPNDPLTIASTAVALGIVALLAGYVPARRATRVNPVLALRYEWIEG